MGESDDKIRMLKLMRAETADYLQDIANGERSIKNGVDVTEQRRQRLQANVQHFDVLIAAYEGVDADRT